VNVPLLAAIALAYPDEEILGVRHEFGDAVAQLPASPARTALARFADWWPGQDPGWLQRHYVQVFDMSRRTSLDLTYVTHGDRRQRGLALLALRGRYQVAGLELATGELPDHLPTMLEFVGRAEPPHGETLLQEFRPVIELLGLGLKRAETRYADVVEAVCDWLPELTAEQQGEVLRLAASGPPVEDVGLEPFAPPEVMPAPLMPTRACSPTPLP
jgi:nitrate reductase delta subunit